MKIIDLLNKIANGEEVPKEIKYKNYIYEYQHRRDTESSFNYMCNENGEYLSGRYFIDNILNDEIEIIEEEKKIPEKLNVISWDKCIHGVTHKEKELAIEINKTQEKVNQVIDYLNSKGDE